MNIISFFKIFFMKFSFRVTNDIALLYLSQDVVFSSKIVPACLPTLATNTYANQMSIVSGKAHVQCTWKHY
jgi:hypothetical protein